MLSCVGTGLCVGSLISTAAINSPQVILGDSQNVIVLMLTALLIFLKVEIEACHYCFQ